MFMFNQRPLLREEAHAGAEGGAKQEAPPFDQAAFQKTLVDEFQKRIDGLDKRYQKTFGELKGTLESFKPKEEKPLEEQAEQHEKGKTQPDLEKQAMQRKLDALTKSFEEERKANQAEKANSERIERFSSIKAKLGGMGLNGEAAMETAFRLFKDEVKRDEDGNLVAGPDNEPFGPYMDRQIKTVYDFLLPPKNASGANASKGSGGTNVPFDLDSIKPGMKPEDRARAQQELQRVLAAG